MYTIQLGHKHKEDTEERGKERHGTDEVSYYESLGAVLLCKVQVIIS